MQELFNEIISRRVDEEIAAMGGMDENERYTHAARVSSELLNLDLERVVMEARVRIQQAGRSL